MSTARAYYNEFDPKAASWLRELIKEGHIAPGDVDERSILDVLPSDLDGYTQCHFFAGIGGWSYALRLARWPDGRPVWTGSCPCQPFSAAGKGDGFADERHLWPAFHYLIEQRSPSVVFGEQVASKDGLAWLDLVQTDLEGSGYTSGAVDLCAASVGAPHIRQRLYWVADAESSRRTNGATVDRGRAAIFESGTGLVGTWDYVPSGVSLVGDADDAGSQGRSERRNVADQCATWEASLVNCRDGKRRPVESGTFPLAHGVPGRVGLLRGYGNAIVPQVAAAFIEAYLDTLG